MSVKVFDGVGAGIKTRRRSGKRRKLSARAEAKIAALRPHQQAFVRPFLNRDSKTFLNRTQAHKANHPLAGDAGAGVAGCRTLKDAKVKEAVVEGIRSLGYSKDDLKHELGWNLETAKSQQNLAQHERTTMSLAKLQGDLVERQELTTKDDTESQQARRIIAEELRKSKDAPANVK